MISKRYILTYKNHIKYYPPHLALPPKPEYPIPNNNQRKTR